MGPPWQWCGNGQFIVITYEWEGNRTVKVKLRAQGYWERGNRIPTYVEVIHAHVL
jgi:hypothetical protein